MAHGRQLDALSVIEEEALDPRTDLTTTLRRCVSLGGTTGGEQLRNWASSELTGYESSVDTLPAFRKLTGVILMDGATSSHRITGQTVTASMLPPDIGADELFNERIRLGMGIAEIEQLVKSAKSKGEGSIRLGIPGSEYLVPLMNHHMGGGVAIDRVYWSVSVVSVVGVLEAVRTKLVGLVAEMRATMPEGASTPTRDVVDSATSVVIYGGKPTINVQRIDSGGGDVVAGQGRDTTVGGVKPETPTRRFTYWLFGLATLAGTAIAVWALWVQ